MRHGFRSGTSRLISRPCYGYGQNSEGRLVAHEDQAKIVQQIFKWRSEGYSLRKISDMLYEQGTLSPNVKPKWGPETLNKLLHNEKYFGNVMQQKIYVPNYLRGIQVRNDGCIDKYFIEDAHERIVD